MNFNPTSAIENSPIVGAKYPEIKGMDRATQEKNVLEFLVQHLYSDLMEILVLKDKFLEVFPSDKYKITFLDGIDVLALIKMYKDANKEKSKEEIIKIHIQKNFAKSIDSIISKLERKGELKDSCRFTIIPLEGPESLEEIAQIFLKTFLILPENYVLDESKPVESKCNLYTGYTDASFQPINTKTGRRIEVIVQSTEGMKAKELEKDSYSTRRSIALEIKNVLPEIDDIDTLQQSLDSYCGNILIKHKNITNDGIEKLLDSLNVNCEPIKILTLIQKYKVALTKTREIFKNVPKVVKSKEDSAKLQEIFDGLKPNEQKSAATNQKAKKENELYFQKLLEYQRKHNKK